MRPFPIGHSEFPRAVLPARDGLPKGGVSRSAPAPNCSYFTNWTSTDDAMTWSIDVLKSGSYEAVMHYTCGAEDVGSPIELVIGNAKWSGRISIVNDPPLRGRQNDRVPRGSESYVKDFRPLSLGVAEIPAGASTLTLRATSVAGKHVADIRAIELILIDPK
jgi:hypothetical protein